LEIVLQVRSVSVWNEGREAETAVWRRRSDNSESDRAEHYTHKIIQYVLEAGKNRADDILSISVIEVELSGGIVMSTTLRETGHVVLGSK
jgi:hypothetical protein